MIYWQDYVNDCVYRKDDNGSYYVKTLNNYHNEVNLSEKQFEESTRQGYGVTSFLEPIDKESYDTFGVKWRWSWKTGEKVFL